MTRRRSLISILAQHKSESTTAKYLTIVALEDGLTASLSTNACEYCIDGDDNWLSLAAGTTTQSVNTGQTLSFRGNLTPNSSTGIGRFTISKKCNLEGNCMSMLFGDNAANNLSLAGKVYVFYKLFYNCKNIVSVSKEFLPATTMAFCCYGSMFSGCTGLTVAPALPATTLASSCYNDMFSECTSLTAAPKLPATTLEMSCYSGMFSDCTSLTTAPALSATTLASNCYGGMFQNCTSLTSVPELPATTLVDSCYQYMFYGCTSLTTAPALPATTSASDCYKNMFYGCTSLTSVPTLPATTLADSCYYGMFQNCSSLTTAPDLPATTLAISCYNNMFRDCSKLNYIKMLATDISASSCLYNWVYGVASIGTFIKDPSMTSLPTGVSGIPSGWVSVNGGGSESAVTDNYLTIYALEDGLTASLSTNACEYCIDGDGNWKSLAAGTATESINTGHRLSFRGNLKPKPINYVGIGTFTISKRCNLEGNCMSMLFGDNAASNNSLSGNAYAFRSLFYNCPNIVRVNSNFLPATILADSCYNGMFSNCTSLTSTPALPATTLRSMCYYSMFSDCTSLTIAPVLPATTLERYCYESMFSGCTSLTTASVLPATTLAEHCYQNMFRGCTSLITAPNLPATSVVENCYCGMFYACTSLITAPALPATTMESGCYSSMFDGCKSLTSTPALPATTLAEDCYSSMFRSCSSLTSAPTLPATTLVERCYRYMFQLCSKLNYIKMLATDISASNCLTDWVDRISSTGTFVKSVSMTSLPTGNNGIPTNWTIADDYTPMSCTSLTITAEDVSGGDTTTTIHYTAVTRGKDSSGNIMNNVTITGTATSTAFPQNTSTTNTVQRTISYTYLGKTATTTITQDVWINSYYTIDLNNQWQKSTTVSNPAPSKYDGVYESFSNYNIGNTAAIMKITIEGYSSFKFYIRSNAESNYDYVTVSQLDQTIGNNTPYTNTTLVKAHTRGNQQSGTALSNYTPVEFTNIDGGRHVITIVYRKDNSVNNGADRGYVLIPKMSENSSDSGDVNNYLTIVALEDGLTASLSDNDCEYCVDSDDNWVFLSAGDTTQSINTGQTLSFRGNAVPSDYSGIGTFTISKKCNLEGNCMSILFGDDAATNLSLAGNDYVFCNLFYECTNIVSVSENFLPATTLAKGCYNNMFYGCTSLTTAPELPATTLADSCYSSMFCNCTNLIIAPLLPAETLAENCYNTMFSGCTSLTTPPDLPATTLTIGCYGFMFSGCTSLTTAPDLPATELTEMCYECMFEYCASLTTAPELPATTLISSCYDSMFSRCTSLTTAPELPATTLADYCYNYMFYECTSLINAPALPATTLAGWCYYQMFWSCSSLTTAPELPATTLTEGCYGYMFEGCEKLSYIKMLATDISASDCLSEWVSGVSSIGTFVKNPEMASLQTGTSGIPSGWTVVDDGEDIEIDTTCSIQYTSSDGNIVTPFDTTVFGANIVNNRYFNGQGIITFDGHITSIGESAFNDCSSLTSITIPDRVTSIGRYAFYGCTSLTSITIPDRVTVIKSWAFGQCISLTNVTIPDSVTSIWDYAFSRCYSLTSVYCKATTPPTGGSNMFSNVSSRKIYVPRNSVDAYKSAEYWSDYASDIEGYDFAEEESGGGKIVNHGHIGQSTGYYIEWEYPVSSQINVVFNIYSPFVGDSTYELPTSINASKSYSPITFGPGESLDSLRSITPIEDDTYLYEIIIE